RYLHHPALTLGFRLEADGVTLVYSSDHEPSTPDAAAAEHKELEELNRQEAQHIAFLRGAALHIPDAQYRGHEDPSKIGGGHSSVEYVVDAARAANARQLALFHHDPTRTDDAVDGLLEMARARARETGFKGEVFAATEGVTVTLESRGALPSRRSVDTAMLA